MPLKELRRFNVKPLQPEDTVPYTDDEIHFKSTIPTVWINLVLTCLAIVAMLIVGRFLYQRYTTRSVQPSKKPVAYLPAAKSIIRMNDIDEEEMLENEAVNEREPCRRNKKSSILLDEKLAEATYSVTKAMVM